ncbi:hypothetical protein HanPI659440_Chr13g0524711 [Helianthus annuus]|nr:hypothetical protein HanPI659440_Chr13g0524711 [Helianthus annuus]
MHPRVSENIHWTLSIASMHMERKVVAFSKLRNGWNRRTHEISST